MASSSTVPLPPQPPDGARKHRVAMVCDFFYPSNGGVENHIHQLAQCLLQQGHKVIVVTHQYGSRKGVRWLAGGLKVYYVPFAAVYDRCVMPTGFMIMAATPGDGIRVVFYQKWGSFLSNVLLCMIVYYIGIQHNTCIYTYLNVFSNTGGCSLAAASSPRASLLRATTAILLDSSTQPTTPVAQKLVVCIASETAQRRMSRHIFALCCTLVVLVAQTAWGARCITIDHSPITTTATPRPMAALQSPVDVLLALLQSL